jgi:hypothetical protein
MGRNGSGGYYHFTEDSRRGVSTTGWTCQGHCDHRRSRGHFVEGLLVEKQNL